MKIKKVLNTYDQLEINWRYEYGKFFEALNENDEEAQALIMEKLNRIRKARMTIRKALEKSFDSTEDVCTTH